MKGKPDPGFKTHLMFSRVAAVSPLLLKPLGKDSRPHASMEVVNAVGIVILRFPAAPPVSHPPVKSDPPGPDSYVSAFDLQETPLSDGSTPTRMEFIAKLELLIACNAMSRY